MRDAASGKFVKPESDDTSSYTSDPHTKKKPAILGLLSKQTHQQSSENMSVSSQSKDSSSEVMQEFMAEFKMSFDRSYSNMFNTILKESLFLDVAALCPEGLLFKSMRVKVAGDMSAAKLSVFALLRVKKVLK